MYRQHKQNENEFKAQMINKEMHHNKGRENTNNQKKRRQNDYKTKQESNENQRNEKNEQEFLTGIVAQNG